jgi:hypothetical protein
MFSENESNISPAAQAAKDAADQFERQQNERRVMQARKESMLNQMAALIAALEDCVEIMERVHPNGLPVSQGTLSEEQDWNKAISTARRVTDQALAMAWIQ